MHGRFVSQPREVGLPLPLTPQERIADVDLGEIQVRNVGDFRRLEAWLAIVHHQPFGALEQMQTLDLAFHRYHYLGFVDESIDNAHDNHRFRWVSVLLDNSRVFVSYEDKL